jgi:hypothetical protein
MIAKKRQKGRCEKKQKQSRDKKVHQEYSRRSYLSPFKEWTRESSRQRERKDKVAIEEGKGGFRCGGGEWSKSINYR